MSASVLPDSPSAAAIVVRLRAAGCVFAEDEARLLISAAQTPAELSTLVERRIGGLPLEHVLGWAEFCGLRIAVDAGVFVPRRRTELLVRHAAILAQRPSALARPLIVDLCCGSGAVAAALTAVLDPVEVHAADIDPAAVRCARRNLVPAGGQVYQGDLYAALPDSLRGRVDVLVANAPYVPSEAVGFLPSEARLHEPLIALDGGIDGLDVLRRVASSAAAWLSPGGALLVETSESQAPVLVETVSGSGLIAHVVGAEDLGATIVIAQPPTPS